MTSARQNGCMVPTASPHIPSPVVSSSGPAEAPRGPQIPLVGLAHGSRKPETAPAIRCLLAAAGSRLGVPAVEAYLEDFAPPSLAEAVAGLGAPAAVVLPLLFTRAYHARIDTPEAVQEARNATGAHLVTAEVLGLGEDVLAVVLAAMERDGIEPDRPVVLLAVGSSNPEANEEVRAFATRLQGRRDASVVVGFATSTQPRAGELLQDRAAEEPALVPLFVAPGLLLDQVAHQARGLGLPVAEPLGDLLAEVLADRYREALGRG